jgi:hypothetical protein
VRAQGFSVHSILLLLYTAHESDDLFRDEHE